MAVLSKGYTFQNTSTVTAGTLHSLVESALISGIKASDVALGTHFVSVGTATPNPSAYPFWYSLDPLDPVFRVYWSSPYDVWTAVGPDRMEVPLRADQTIPLGALVCSSAPSTCTLMTSPSFAAVGFCQSTTASGSWAPIAMYGIGWVLFQSSASAGGGGDSAPTAGAGIRAYGCPAGGCYAQGTGSNGGSGPFFGMWLEGQRSGASGSNVAYRAPIWGGFRSTVAP